MNTTSNTVFIILSACIVAAGLFWYFRDGESPDPSLTVTATQSEAQAQFQTLVTQLQPIKLDSSIFNDTKFLALRDLTTSIIQETIGRSDPFASVPGTTAQ